VLLRVLKLVFNIVTIRLRDGGTNMYRKAFGLRKKSNTIVIIIIITIIIIVIIVIIIIIIIIVVLTKAFLILRRIQ
jgi:hypothetical protein